MLHCSAGGKALFNTMEIPRYTHQAHRPSLPEIYVHESSNSERNRNSNRAGSFSSRYPLASSAAPMTIQNLRQSPPPPPLPPPRYVDVGSVDGHGGNSPDIGWHWSNSREDGGWGRPSASINPGSSLYGSFASRGKSLVDDRPDFNRRGSSASTIKSISGVDARQDSYPRIDEGYASLSGTSIDSNQSKLDNSLPTMSGFQSSVHDKFRSNAQAYDKSLLQKLDSRRTTDNATPPQGYHRASFSSSLNDSPTTRIANEHQNPSFKALSLPSAPTTQNNIESPLSRWATGNNLAVSPMSHYANGHGRFDFRSSSDRDDFERSPRTHNIQSDDNGTYSSRSAMSSHDHSLYADPDSDFPMEETGLRRLHIDDNMSRVEGRPLSSAAGHKRRASSPPPSIESGLPSLHTVGSAGDLHRRRESASRASPSPLYHSSHGSVSSSTASPRNNSYSSNLSLAATSITTMSSYGRLSPGGTSPGAISPRSTDSIDSPYPASLSLNASPRASTARPTNPRLSSDTRPAVTTRKSPDATSVGKGSSHFSGNFICECCPKKPKKFETEEELTAHESEKQYECAYCKNRFKNKNEAERHQNSLHLRRHSWSCAALTGYNAAFHQSPSHPTEADTCGYCGDEFPRSGPISNSIEGRIATDLDWEIRIQHLVDVHKFNECNHAKKFFRADHFRQHLKHSHAGTSGKWTNMLENACMKDEPLPEPLVRGGPERINISSPIGSNGIRPDRINEEDELMTD